MSMWPLFPRRRFVASNIYINGEEAVISLKLHDNFRQIVPTLVVRYSGVFAEIEPNGDESGNN